MIFHDHEELDDGSRYATARGVPGVEKWLKHVERLRKQDRTIYELPFEMLSGAEIPRAKRPPAELFGPLLLKDDVVTARPQYRDFELHIPEGPGLGVHIDEEKLAFYRRDQ